MKIGIKDIILSLLSVVLTYFIFQKLKATFSAKDYLEIKNTLANANFFWIGISVGLGFFAYYIRAVRWQMILNPMGYNPKTINLLASVASTYFGNAVIPRSGELLRCAIIKKTEGIPIDKSFGTLITERIVDLFFLLLTITLALILNFKLLYNFLFLKIFMNLNLQYIFGIVTSIIFVIICAFFFRNKLKEFSVVIKIRNTLSGFTQGVLSIKDLKNIKLYLFYSILIWLAYFFMTYIVVFCFKGLSSINPSEGLVLLVMGAFGMIIPTPGGIGSYHASIILAITLLGYSPVLGSALGFTIHMGHYILGVITGSISTLYAFVFAKNSEK